MSKIHCWPTQQQALLEASVYTSTCAASSWTWGVGGHPLPEGLLYIGYKLELPATSLGRCLIGRAWSHDVMPPARESEKVILIS